MKTKLTFGTILCRSINIVLEKEGETLYLSENIRYGFIKKNMKLDINKRKYMEWKSAEDDFINKNHKLDIKDSYKAANDVGITISMEKLEKIYDLETEFLKYIRLIEKVVA